jgi:glycosyltransferase 2 family protein
MFRQVRGKILLSLIFGVLVIGALSLVADVRQLGVTLSHFNWALLPLILGLTLFNYALRFVKWQYYLRLIGVRDLSTRDSAGIFYSAFTMVLTPGKVGELLKSYMLRRVATVPIARTAPLILAERMTDGLAMVILASIGLALIPSGWPILLLTLIAAVGGMLVIQHRPTAERILVLGERFKPLSGRIHHLREFYESSYEILRPRPFGLAVLCGLISWSGECFAFYLVLRGLGLPHTWTLLIAATAILALATLIGSASMLPGGLGVADASIAGLLLAAVASPLMTRDVAVAASLLIRFATLWFGVGIGAVVVLLFWRRFSGFGDAVVGLGETQDGEGWDVGTVADDAAPMALPEAQEASGRVS